MTVNLDTMVIMDILELLECKDTFMRIAMQFKKKFPDPSSHLDTCKGIGQLLQQSDLLECPEQQLVAVFLIYEAFSDREPSLNPLLNLLIKLLHPPEHRSALVRLPIQGRWFLSSLMSAPTETKSLMNYTAKQILSRDENDCVLCDTSNLEILLVQQLSRMTAYDKSGASNLLLIGPPGPNNENLRKEAVEELLSIEPSSFTPTFHRLAPPLHLEEDTLIWLEPISDYVSNLKLLWDDTMCASSAPPSEIKRLLGKAFKNALTPNQQQQLISGLKAEPQKISQLGLSPGRLPGLVENNPTVAVEALILMADNPHIIDFYSALVSMELSLHSMEVVNRLTTEAATLPVAFIHQYVLNCIATCESMSARFTQSRHVRLVCVFLSSLIRNRLIDIRELFIEVQAFCIEFSKIKEAASLFRLLRTVDPPADV